ncbi:cupin domain-containing protein [Pseudomonas sp. SDO55104_S430]
MSEPTTVLLARADGNPVSTTFTRGPLGAGDPFGALRKTAYASPGEIAAGLVEASGQFSIEDYPYSEMIVVHCGRVILQSLGSTLELGPGSSAVIGRGSQLQVEAHDNARWAFCADIQSIDERNPGLTELNPLAALAPSQGLDAAILLSPAPQCRSNSMFIEEPTKLNIGVWDSTPYTRRGRPHKLHELMHLIEGRVTLQAADGSELTVNTGDTVFVPKGVPCAWKSTVYVRKLYAVK